jgi:hypothetical protein
MGNTKQHQKRKQREDMVIKTRREEREKDGST